MPTDRQHHVVSENETVGAAFSLDPLEVDGVHQVRAMDEEERRGNVLHDIPEGKPDIGSTPAGAVVVVNVAVVVFYAYMG